MSFQKYLVFITLITGFLSISWETSETDNPIYLDASQPVDKRVEDLLGKMTLEEKIGQMNMPCLYVSQMGTDLQTKTDACKKFTEGTFIQGLGPGGGFFTLANTMLHEGASQQAIFFNELQKIAVEKTRLKIPLIQIEEGTHGLMCSGGTVFPEGLAIGSTWNIKLIEKIYSTAAREARAIGVHELFTLVVEPNREPRLGRNQEGFSEDTYMCSQIAKSIVKGAQGKNISAKDKVITGLCHFPGQSQSTGGLERGGMDISERVLRQTFLPPFEAGIKEGALGVMATYPAIDGVPTHCSEKILTQILRNELGFEGLVLSEGGGFATLIYERVAETQKDAGAMSIKAGVDVGITFEQAYMDSMIANVKEGKVPMELIDRAVRRILRIKFLLGLFENPYAEPEYAAKVVHTKEHEELALQTSREGIVLLKNENNLLPLNKSIKSIAVIGPNANHDRNQLGDYIANIVLQDVVTVYEGIKNKVSPETDVVYVKGCNVLGTELNEITQATEAAKKADVAIVVVGENERGDVTAVGVDRSKLNRPKGTNGEGRDVANLDLTGMQEELVKAVFETGTPTIVVLINGRPLSTRWIAEHIPAIVEPWICGEQGGNAIADILFGDYNPSGHLPITIPRHAGQLPVFYNSNPSKAFWVEVAPGIAYTDMRATPLYEFGYGLSYTSFEYSNLQILNPKAKVTDDIKIKMDITNTGSLRGADVVQLYIADVISTINTPVKQLKGFEKVMLEPGEKKSVEFTLTPYDLSLINQDMKRVVEPGKFDVMIGASSKDIKLKGSFVVE